MQGFLPALDLPQLFRRHFVMVGNARRQTGGCRLIPHRQARRGATVRESRLRHAGFVERAAHAELLRGDAAGTVVAAIVGVGAVGDARKAAITRELASVAYKARVCRSSSGSRDSRGTRRDRFAGEDDLVMQAEVSRDAQRELAVVRRITGAVGGDAKGVSPRTSVAAHAR